MNKNEILEKVIIICKDVFDNAELELSETSCATDIEEWDSLSNLSIISDLESEFGISFTLEEISNTLNLGEIAEVIMKHLSI